MNTNSEKIVYSLKGLELSMRLNEIFKKIQIEIQQRPHSANTTVLIEEVEQVMVNYVP